MPKKFLLLCFLCWPAVAGQQNSTADLQSVVEFSLEEQGLENSLVFFPEVGLLFARPIPGTKDLLGASLKNEDLWRRDSPSHAQKMGADGCYRRRQAGVGSLHVCVYQDADCSRAYLLHVDWHYSGWDHPVSAVKHIAGECWPHKVLGTKTNYRRLLATVKRNSIKH